MSKIKKLIALTLALAMVLSVSAFAGSYSENTYADADKINADCEEAVELLYALDIMVGDGKNFNPESAVTRAEMAKMIYVILNYGDDDKAVTYTGAKFFTDVEAGYWAEGYINYCAATKLIAGRGDGTFDPTAPVTTAEAAKMLLTAIGYSAEARGYVGANWDKNVLADASIIGLLNGYKANVNTYAPRQWVAVMIENMLLDALTYDTMAPTFSGLLTSGSENIEGYKYPTMGGKYYGLKSFVGYLYATPNAYVDGDGVAPSKKLIFNDGDDELVVKSSALGFADLGQEYRVIYDASTSNNTPYSIKATGASAVAEDILQNITAEVTYGTSSNRSNNKYFFTVGDMTANCGKTYGANKYASAHVLTNNLEAYLANDGVAAYVNTKAADLYDGFVKTEPKSNDLVKVIDRDGDGDIEYILYCDFTYAVITDADTSSKYGDFVTAEDFAGNTVYGLDGGARLYLKDMIECEDELEIGNYVKAYFDVDDEVYAVEVLPIEEVTYDKKSTKDVYTFSGEKYEFADEAFLTSAEFDADYDYEDEILLVYDGNLVIAIADIDNTYAALEKINEQLAIVYDWQFIEKVQYAGGPEGGENLYEFSYMTIDGEKHTAKYTLSGKYDDDMELAQYEKAEKIADWVDKGWRLFVLHNDSNNTVWFEDPYKVCVNEDGLNASSKLLDGYFGELADVDLNTSRETLSDIDAKGFEHNTTTDACEMVAINDRAEIANDVLFFVRTGATTTTAGKYEVKTLAELDLGSVEDRTVQVYYKTNARNVPVIVAGYIDARGLDAGTADGYLFLTEPADGFERTARSQTNGYSRWTALVNLGYDKEPVEATVQLGYSEKPVEGALYQYTKSTSTGIYTLTKIVEADDAVIEALYKNSNEVELSTDIIKLDKRAVVLSIYETDLDETYTASEAMGKIEDGTLETTLESMEFVTIDELIDANVLCEEDATYEYAVKVYTDDVETDSFANGVFYVELYKLMNPAQDIEADEPEQEQPAQTYTLTITNNTNNILVIDGKVVTADEISEIAAGTKLTLIAGENVTVAGDVSVEAVMGADLTTWTITVNGNGAIVVAGTQTAN